LIFADNQFLAIADGCKLSLWDAEMLEQRSSSLVKHKKAITGMVLGLDSIFTSSLDGQILQWKIKNRDLALSDTLIVHPEAITCMDISGDKNVIAFGSECFVTLVDIAKQFHSPGRGILGKLDNEAPIVSLVTSKCSDILIAACQPADGSQAFMRIWNSKTKQKLHYLDYHLLVPQALAISPDGKYFATGADDHKVFLSEVKNPRNSRTVLIGHTDKVTGLAFAYFRDDLHVKTLVSSSHDLTLRLWNLEPPSHGGVPEYLHEDHRQVVRRDNMQSRYPGGKHFRFSFQDSHEQGFYGWDGWVLDNKNKKLFWVSPRQRTAVRTPGTFRVVGVDRNFKVNMSRFVHGPDWKKCFTG
jgi:WD40 repeat protein